MCENAKVATQTNGGDSKAFPTSGLHSTTPSGIGHSIRLSTSSRRNRGLSVPPRPPNAWILYRTDKMRELQRQRDAAMANSNGFCIPTRPSRRSRRSAGGKASRHSTGGGALQAEVSRVVSHMWKYETPDRRAEYAQLAQEHKALHRQRYPDYKYQPRRRSITSTTVDQADVDVKGETKPEEAGEEHQDKTGNTCVKPDPDKIDEAKPIQALTLSKHQASTKAPARRSRTTESVKVAAKKAGPRRVGKSQKDVRTTRAKSSAHVAHGVLDNVAHPHTKPEGQKPEDFCFNYFVPPTPRLSMEAMPGSKAMDRCEEESTSPLGTSHQQVTGFSSPSSFQSFDPYRRTSIQNHPCTFGRSRPELQRYATQVDVRPLSSSSLLSTRSAPVTFGELAMTSISPTAIQLAAQSPRSLRADSLTQTFASWSPGLVSPSTTEGHYGMSVADSDAFFGMPNSADGGEGAVTFTNCAAHHGDAFVNLEARTNIEHLGFGIDQINVPEQRHLTAVHQRIAYPITPSHALHDVHPAEISSASASDSQFHHPSPTSFYQTSDAVMFSSLHAENSCEYGEQDGATT